MELDDLKKSWKEQDQKLELTLNVNQEQVKKENLKKTKNVFGKFILFRFFEAAFNLAAMILSAFFILNNWPEIQFVISGFIFSVLVLSGFISSALKILTARSIDFSEPAAVTQKKLASLKTQILVYIRLGILSLPFFPIYIIIGFKALFDVDIWNLADSDYWTANFILCILFIPISIFVFQKISFKNLHIKWVRSFLESSGGKQFLQALEMLNEIEEFSKEKVKSDL